MAHNDGDPPPSKPLTLVGGYLGSGKTTLINRFLASPDAGRTAVVVNDFGDVNIDGALIRAAGADTLELTNGCICCQITDDVQTTMAGLAARADIDAVICEVSGIGDPSQLGTWRTFPGFRAGPVVVCADAGATEARLADEYVADVVRAQLVSADVVLVTKADRVPAEQVARARKVCARIAPGALVRVLDADATGLIDLVHGSEAGPAGHGTPASGTDRGSSPAESAPHVDHADRHRTVTVPLAETLTAEAVVAVLSRAADALVRAKGFVPDVRGRWSQVQLAGGSVTEAPLPESDSAPQRAELVLIAAGPQADGVLEQTTAALARPGGSDVDDRPSRDSALDRASGPE